MNSNQHWYELILRAFLHLKGQEWILGEMLGEGGSAAVWKVTSPGCEYALKLYKPQFLAGENELVEKHRVNLQGTLCSHHCNDLIQIHEVGFVGESAYILMDYVPWPSMDVVIGAVPAHQFSVLLACVARAAKWLHERGYVHRDIKPANILVSPQFDRAILVDLGVMRIADGTENDLTDHGSKRPFVATAQYSPPEYLFRTIEPSPDLWRALTYYQLGAVLHDLLTRTQLFDQEVKTFNKYVLAMAVMSKIPSFAMAEKNPRLVALASRCLDKKFESRLENVEWSDFLDCESFDADFARSRLLLRASRVRSVCLDGRDVEKVSQIENRCSDEVGSILRRVCEDEGYPRVIWQTIKDKVRLAIELEMKEFSGYFVLCLRSKTDSMGSGVEIFISAGICESLDGLSAGFRERKLFHVPLTDIGNLDILKKDLMSEELLRSFYKATQISDGISLEDLPVDLRD
ncbi:serine/threonine protein kinase [Xanthomonas campestris]|uniref:serine/threonine protein kinase n=1 Tax=Xanthomonas campestris TaxID=339 RepID=UPI0023686A30|nr:protein kinase [Xanthomonas campestris]WDI93185.1 protein kinase [Xanthomonas campestris]